jgi:hypothetical protein
MDNLQGFNFATRKCSVCTKGFQGGDNMRLLACGHVFHMECTTLWLSQHASCPHCKASVKYARDFKVRAADGQRPVDESLTVPESNNDDTQPMLNARPPTDAVEIQIPPPVVDGS